MTELRTKLTLAHARPMAALAFDRNKYLVLPRYELLENALSRRKSLTKRSRMYTEAVRHPV